MTANKDKPMCDISAEIALKGISNNIPMFFTLNGMMKFEISQMSNLQLIFYSFFPSLFVKRCQKKLSQLKKKIDERS